MPAKKLFKGIEYDINKRWEEGIDHHPKSIELMSAIAKIDFLLCDDHFSWKIGGDGDNGEILMYEMDIYFEEQDILNPPPQVILRLKNTEREDILTGLRLWLKQHGRTMIGETRDQLFALTRKIDEAGSEW